MAMFKNIAERLEKKVSFDFLKKISNQNFLEHNSTPVLQYDKDQYGFTWIDRIFDNTTINEESKYYSPSDKEMAISDDLIEQILS
jgi:hypothetical protein